jgi:hypothetical protein
MIVFLTIYGNLVQWLEGSQLTCPSKRFFHIDCPGCGMQRSFILLVKGELLPSIQLYPALIPLFFLWVYLIAHLIFRFKNGARNLQIFFGICAGIIFVHYIYKAITLQLF